MVDHSRASSYAFGTPAREPTSQHTSSAFSASAQPNEDWTKISDLAERRRIQNRIAQRNYRKKLKKRLEDLERKAASTSASPEPTPAELPTKVEKSRPKTTAAKRRPSPPHHQQSSTTELPASSAIGEDWSMFSNQFTRQVSTSPPPFAFPTLDSFPTMTSPQPQTNDFSCAPGSMTDFGLDNSYSFQPFMQPFDSSSQFQWQDKSMPTKADSLFDSQISPLDISGYVPMGHMAMSFPTTTFPDGSYSDASFLESSLSPELCDMYDVSSAGSPGEHTTFPQTPLMMPLSPPFNAGFEQ